MTDSWRLEPRRSGVVSQTDVMEYTDRELCEALDAFKAAMVDLSWSIVLLEVLSV